MTGLSRDTGRLVELDAHLAQSIADILTTPIGTRVIVREYGSDLPRLIDAPINGETQVDLFVATAEALERWEPRYRLTRVEIAAARAGHVDLRLTGEVDGAARQIAVEVAA
jgi:phage baseplate assembly protein W